MHSARHLDVMICLGITEKTEQVLVPMICMPVERVTFQVS
jgi:hypothetical protein